MADSPYFWEVAKKTSTRFWINNPGITEAELAIDAGAAGCTTNPAYASKMLQNSQELPVVQSLIAQAVKTEERDDDAAGLVQRNLVKRLCASFMPLYEKSSGREGYVTIQSDPLRETDPSFIINEGRKARSLAPNVMIKIPVTEAGIAAIKTLVAEDCPLMATEVMSVSQALCICGAYAEASAGSGKSPAFYVTHITGILDDYFKNVVLEKKLDLPGELLAQAGISIAKRQYVLLKERRCPGRMMGGGARKLADFTELVGGDLSVTINWKGTADELIKTNPPVVSRIDDLAGSGVVERLRNELPGYKEAYDEGGLTPAEFFDYGGVELFRNAFVKGWNELKSAVKEARRKGE
jgi:transaldolase